MHNKSSNLLDCGIVSREQSNDRQPWLQINLNKIKKITGIVTQGAKTLGKEMFVRAYVLEYSDDGTQWTKYTDDEYAIKVPH